MYDSFILGHNYTIGEIKNRTDEKLPTFGIEKIFICNNSDTIFLFSDLIENKEFPYGIHKYIDSIKNKNFTFTDYRFEQHVDIYKIDELKKGKKEILLFIQNGKDSSVNFIYFGRLKYIKHQKKTKLPMSFLFNLVDYDNFVHLRSIRRIMTSMNITQEILNKKLNQ